MPDILKIPSLVIVACMASACTPGNRIYTQEAAAGTDQVTIKGYSRNFLFAADQMAFDLASVETQTYIPYLSRATVNPGRYCVQARRWTMILRGSDMTMSESACFDAEAGHTYLIRRREGGFRVIDRRNPTVVTFAETEQG